MKLKLRIDDESMCFLVHNWKSNDTHLQPQMYTANMHFLGETLPL